jgi:hypothetical protein
MLRPGFVFIVESPSADEFRTGRYEGTSLVGALSASQIPYHYCVAVNREAFADCFAIELDEARRRFPGQHPIIHLSIHGRQDGTGVVLTDGTLLNWWELGQWLGPINAVMAGGLLLCLSACFGSAGREIARFAAAPPFWALVGNHFAVGLDDLAVGYSAFYHRFFKGAEIADAVVAMQHASGNGQFAWLEGTAWHRWFTEETIRRVWATMPTLQPGGLNALV